jgi:peptidoglycan hydrolase-like protein with peptidoglycan-binding domain
MKARHYLLNGVTAAVIGLGSLAFAGTAAAAGSSYNATSGNGMSNTTSGGGKAHSGSSKGMSDGGMNNQGMSNNGTASGSSSAGNSHTSNMRQSNTGASKAHIKKVQRKLNAQGDQLNVDGVLGPKTRSALKKYQRGHNLPVTGTPNQKTIQKLGARKY